MPCFFADDHPTEPNLRATVRPASDTGAAPASPAARLSRRALLLGALATTPGLAARAAPTTGGRAGADPAETRRLHALFAESWERSARDHPEYASYRGDRRFDDRLTDASATAIARRDAQARQTLQRARAIRRSALSSEDRLSLDVFVYGLAQQVRLQAFEGYATLSLGSSGGFQTSFAQLLGDSPSDSRHDAEMMLARMAAYPQRVDQEIERLRLGVRLGWVTARPVLARVIAQIDGQLPVDAAAGPFYEPFTRLGSVAASDRQALQDRARRAIDSQIAPALRRLRAFVADDYLPHAPDSGALAGYPGGAAVYAAVVEEQTTTRKKVHEIHALGLEQVARLRAEMEAIVRELKFDGDVASFVRFINTDPRFFHPDGAALLTGYRDIAKRIDPELPRLFARLPRMPYGIRAIPAHLGEGQAEYYSGPALDGSRAGWFSANTLAYKTRPIWGMETLVAHETVPGHHLQTALAAEASTLPPFRRDGDFTAYGEGWALYAETLGPELGLYSDPYSRYGHLQSVIFRAARLVVDTGLHALGWSRQQAIDYMIDRTGEDPVYVATEVDRYYSSPGQALAYMIGALKIAELRERARQRLGERFEIRQFHRAVLDPGPLPLDVLDEVVETWIDAASRQRDATAYR